MKGFRVTRWVMAAAMACGLAAAAFPGAAQAGDRTIFFAALNGFEEVPAVSSPGRGGFVARLVGDELHFSLSYRGLAGSVAQAHIHFGRRATSGNVVSFLCGGPAPPCPPGGGKVSGTITAAEVTGAAGGQGIDAGEFEELVKAMAAGATYINVHTDVFPSGEIRGQVR